VAAFPLVRLSPAIRSRALSVALQKRVLAAHERREGSQWVLAERFGVALGAVNG